MIKVNHAEISEHQINQEMQYHPADDQRQAMIKASEALVIAELLKQKAQQLEIDVDDNEQFVETVLEQQVDIPEATEEECKLYYARNKAKFTTSPLLAVRHILLACTADDQEKRSQLLEQAEAIIATLQADPDQFASLAKAHSSCSSAEVGGQLGQISHGQTVAEFERQVFSAEVGLINKPIETRYGIHVACVDRRVDGKQLPFEAVHDNIRNYLNQKVRNKAISQFISTLIDDAHIEGFEFNKREENIYH